MMMGLTRNLIYGRVPFGSFEPPPHPWLLGPWATQIISHGLQCKTYALEQGHIGEFSPTDSPHGGIPLWSIQVYTPPPPWMSHDSIFSTPIWMKFTFWLRSKATSLWIVEWGLPEAPYDPSNPLLTNTSWLSQDWVFWHLSKWNSPLDWNQQK